MLDRIYNINERDFDTVATEVWHYQYEGNDLYRAFCQMLGKTPANVISTADIPFMPITFFRDHVVKTGEWDEEVIFRSSGTTGTVQSKHLVCSQDWYHRIAQKIFASSFGPPADYVFLALLPSYIERNDSSLIDMVHHFMQQAKFTESGFYMESSRQMVDALSHLAERNQKTILIGVSFALYDLFEKYIIPVWDNLTVIETGGMKGRRTEITREELHDHIRLRHAGLKIASEYGMTELLSQAYMTGHHFKPGFTMKVLIRDISDPLQLSRAGQRGAINIIDLANVDTCSFIATDDIGIMYVDGSFDVIGRLDQSDVRGCNLMYA